MLVLTRKVGERIVINKDIVITVVELHNGKCRLGITAPKEVPVSRQELFSEEEQARIETLVLGRS